MSQAAEQNERQQQIRKHHEKWKKWKIELKKQQQQPLFQPSSDSSQSQSSQQNRFLSKPQDNAAEYARKLIQKLESPLVQSCPISKDMADQLQNNTCTICLELMAPPSIPYILFPCGHNICKRCLFSNGDQKRQKYILNINKCPLCRFQIINYAQNRNLVKLICSYLNKKEQLQKQLKNDQVELDPIGKLTQHCQILQKQRKNLSTEIQSLKKQKKVMEQVIDRLLEERRRCRRQMDVLEQEGRLVNRHINEKQEQLEVKEENIAKFQEKERNVDDILRVVRVEKDKLERGLAEKLINKGKAK